MLAYKFRSLENFGHVADIILKKRFYCSDPELLNDARECDIRGGNHRGRELEVYRLGRRVNDILHEYRVCCLGRSPANERLWAHYGGGYGGVAIEVDLPDSHVVEVQYRDDPVLLSDFLDTDDARGAALAALSRKRVMWRDEQELRIITTEPFYRLAGINRLIAGPKTGDTWFRTLSLMCDQLEIRLDRAVIGESGIYTTRLEQESSML